MRPPLRYVDGNILFGQNSEVAALYRIPVVSYRFLSWRDKKRWASRLSRLASELKADFSLYRVERAWEVSQYEQMNMGLLERNYGNRDEWATYLADGARRMADMHSFSPEVYLAVSLHPAKKGGLFGGGSSKGSGETGRVLSELFGLAPPRPVNDREVDRLRKQEGITLGAIKSVFVNARAASTEELQWLYLRSGSRGVSEPILDEHWRPDGLRDAITLEYGSYRPAGAEFVRLVNASVKEQSGVLHVTHHGVTSYQKFLCMAGQPEDVEFPGAQAEMMYAPLAAMHFPVDLVLHVTYLPNKVAKSEAHKKVMDADNTWVEEASGSTGASQRSDENRDVARRLENRLDQADNAPLLKVRLSYAVGGKTASECEENARVLKDSFGSGFTLYEPTGLQEQLWYDHLPRADGGRFRDYEGWWTIEQFGTAMAVGSQKVGTHTGSYFAYTSEGGRQPVFYDPTYASLHNKAPAIVVCGAPGSGKTMTCQVLAYAAKKRGSMVVTLDPKPDHSLHDLPDMDMTVVELSGNSQYRGLLDPLTFGDPDMRQELAWSFLMDLLGNEDYKTPLRGAIQVVLQRNPNPRLGDVIAALEQGVSDASRKAAQDLTVWRMDNGIAALAFGSGQTPTIQSRDGVTFRFPKTGGLVLPKAEKDSDKYTAGERLNVAMVGLAAAYATQVAADASRHALVLLDEAWALYKTSMGEALVDRLFRLGRSQQATLMLATQAPTDLEDVADSDAMALYVGTYLMFGMGKSRTAARAAIKLLGLDTNDELLIDRFGQYESGLGLMRDESGNTAEIQVDPDPRLLRALDTSPNKQRHLAGVGA